MPPYQYSRLQGRQIRVFWLVAGFPGDPVCGRLETVEIDRFVRYINDPRASLSSCPDWFMALSYCWGSDNKPFQIPTPDGTIDATASLYSALSRVRLRESNRPLWADAICINQSDVEEKSHQIALMGEIYSCAYATIVDLGEATPDTEAALRLMSLFFRHAIPKGLNYGGTPLSYEQSLGFLGLPAPPPFPPALPSDDDPVWLAVRNFLRRPYFRRLWIVQEFVLARETTILCGDLMLDWRPFWAMFEAYNNFVLPAQVVYDPEAQAGQISIASLGSSRRMHELGRSEAMILHDLLERFASHKVSVARDRYFSLLAIARDGNNPSYQPDYASSLEVVVARIGRAMLQGDRGHETLMAAGMSTAPDRFPSWFPDWGCKDKSRFGFNHHLQSWNATLDSNFELILDPREQDVIHVYGHIVDTIVRVEHWSKFRADSNDVEDWTPGYLATCADLFLEAGGDAAYVAGGTALEACWRTSIANFLQSDQVNYGPGFQAMYESMTRGGSPLESYERIGGETGRSVPEMRQLLHEYLVAVAIATSSFTLSPALTRKGYFALVPESCQIGDEAWLVSGCRLPLVLRASIERKGMFRLVGSGYVHGVMDGNILKTDEFQFGQVSLY